jgi:hypothetical protein
MLFISAFSIAAPAGAAEGIVLINQNKVLNGNVTAGDTPGFPLTISERGSYRLSGNLQVPADTTGILVNSTEVSIDLNGFSIDGGDVAATGIDGRQRSLTVRNGTIRAFKQDGIYARGALLIVEDMRVSENDGSGIQNEANGWARIVNSTVFGNLDGGIVCAASCHVEGNIVSNNTLSGVRIDSGTVLGNTIITNQGFGIFGVSSATGFGNNTILNNSAGSTAGGPRPLFPNACLPAC